MNSSSACVLLCSSFLFLPADTWIGTSLAQDEEVRLAEIHPGYSQIGWADLKHFKNVSQIPITAQLYSAPTPHDDKHFVHRSLLHTWRNELTESGGTRVYWYSRGNWYAPDEYEIITTNTGRTVKLLAAKFNSPHISVIKVGDNRVSVRPATDLRDLTPHTSIGSVIKWRQGFINRCTTGARGWALFTPGQIFLPVKNSDRGVYRLTDDHDLLNRLRQSNRAISCTENEKGTVLRIRLGFRTTDDASSALTLLRSAAQLHMPKLFADLKLSIDGEVLIIDVATRNAAEAISSSINALRKVN